MALQTHGRLLDKNIAVPMLFTNTAVTILHFAPTGRESMCEDEKVRFQLHLRRMTKNLE
jgi:hypothetical protein